MTGLLVVLNGQAGAMAGAPEAATRVRDAFARAGSDAAILSVEPDGIAEAVRDAVARGVDVIFVGGGDGTVTTAARCLVGSATALAPLPLGTRNHFARDLKVPLAIDEAVKSLLEGVVTEVDVGEVNGLTFVNNVSIGIYPQAVRRREWHQHRIGMTKGMAWMYAIVNVFWRYPMQVLRLRWEGRETIVRTPFVLVGNNEYVIAAEDFGRRVSLRDGKLSAYYAPRVGRFRFLWNATKALFGFVRDGLDLEKIITTRLTVESRKRELDVAVDGEVQSFRLPLEFRVRPRTLRVVVPRSQA